MKAGLSNTARKPPCRARRANGNYRREPRELRMAARRGRFRFPAHAAGGIVFRRGLLVPNPFHTRRAGGLLPAHREPRRIDDATTPLALFRVGTLFSVPP